jgi:RND superfamily putative drug exporter
MNLLAAAASFGVVVAVFQWGWGSELLGLGKAGPIQAELPLVMLAILFGLSMDYQVFLVSRMHEEWQHSRDNHRAIRVGQTETGRLINAAALVMVCVFTAFVFSGQRVIAEYGVGLAVAVAIDAFVLRTALVPALMHLLGPANWWLPGRLDRILPRFSIEGTQAVDTSAVRVPPTRRTSPVVGETTGLSTPREPKSAGVAYLWWFALGLFGGHHFYLGRTGWGVLYLCTIGFGGVGWLADALFLPWQIRRVNGRIARQGKRPGTEAPAVTTGPWV